MSKNGNIKISKDGCVIGIVLVLAAVLLVLEGLGMGFGAYGISLWKVALGVLLVAWLLKELIRLRIENIFFPIAFIFILFEENIAGLLGREDGNIISNWYVILAAVLLTVGFNEIFHVVRKEKYCGYVEAPSSGHVFGGSTTYIDAADLGKRTVNNEFGNTTVYIENKEAYLGNGVIRVDNAFGNMVLHVPSNWYVSVDIENGFGSVATPRNDNVSAPRLEIIGENGFGTIRIIKDIM